jgi:metal-responsive CopG/Arc/MetJ family transcriptional regulator
MSGGVKMGKINGFNQRERKGYLDTVPLLDERSCLLVIAVKGKIKTIQSLAKDLMNKRGIKQLKLAIVKL